MFRICAWCGIPLSGPITVEQDTAVTHGICGRCYRAELKVLKDKHHRMDRSIPACQLQTERRLDNAESDP